MTDMSILALQALPDHYKNLAPNFADFIQSYYRWKQEVLPRNDADLRNIDITEEQFVAQFKEEYAANIKTKSVADDRLLIKNIVDLYRAKGSPRAFDLFFRIVHGVGAQIHYPREDTLRTSDGQWIRPQYLEISSNDQSLVGQQIVGPSGGQAFCETIVTQYTDTGYRYIAWIADSNDQFEIGEPIYVATPSATSPTVVGSLRKMDVSTSVTGIPQGTPVTLSSTTGTEAKGKVNSVSVVTSKTQTKVTATGSGYTLHPEIKSSEVILLTTDVVSGGTPSFPFGNTIGQTVYVAELPSQSNAFNVGDAVTLTTLNGANTSISAVLGTVAVVEPTYDSGDRLILTSSALSANVVSTNYISTPTANSYLAVVTSQPASGKVTGTDQDIILTHGAVALPFLYNQKVYQYVSTTKVAEGTIGNRINPTTVNCRIDSGAFRSALPIVLTANNAAPSAATITSVTWNVGVHDVVNKFYPNIDATCGSTAGEVVEVTQSNTPGIRVTDLKGSHYLLTATVDAAYSAAESVPTAGTYRAVKVGFVEDVTGTYDSDTNTITSIRQPMVSALAVNDLVDIGLVGSSLNFKKDEIVIQTGLAVNSYRMTFSSVTGIVPGSLIVAGSLGSPTKAAVVHSVDYVNNTIKVTQATAAFTSPATLYSTSTGGSISLVTIAAETAVPTAYGRVIANDDGLRVLSGPLNLFAVGGTVTGLSSGATGVIDVVTAVTNAIVGNNIKLDSQIRTEASEVLTIDIIDSGHGFKEGDTITVKANDVEIATGTAVLGSAGILPGYHRKSPDKRQFLYDGYYYQDFSYEIQTAVPFDKYEEAVTGPLQITGTQVFGKVVLNTNIPTQAQLLNADIREINV